MTTMQLSLSFLVFPTLLLFSRRGGSTRQRVGPVGAGSARSPLRRHGRCGLPLLGAGCRQINPDERKLTRAPASALSILFCDIPKSLVVAVAEYSMTRSNSQFGFRDNKYLSSRPTLFPAILAKGQLNSSRSMWHAVAQRLE